MSIGYKLRKSLDAAIDKSKSGWDLRTKTKLFINPEARCPYCDGWFPTNRVWLINDQSHYIKGCWNLDGSPISEGKIVHPHSWRMSGEVCLGEAKTASEALFAGVAKGKHVYCVPRWLVEIGHDCERLPYKNCPACSGKFFVDVEFYFGFKDTKLCSAKCLEIAQMFRCENCMKVLDMDQRRFCAECRIGLYIECNICSKTLFEPESRYYSRRELRCCYDCYNILRGCNTCGYMELRSELNDRRVCTYCVEHPAFICDACGESFSSNEELNGDNICERCENYCGDCGSSPCQCEPSFEMEEEEEEEDEAFV